MTGALTQPREFQEAIALNDWRLVVVGQEPRLTWLFHIANGELREKRIAAKLKAMGVLPGVVDYFLPVPVAPYHGLYLELKRAGLTHTRVLRACTADQRQFLEAMYGHGYAAYIASGWVEAARRLCEYLHRPDLAP